MNTRRFGLLGYLAIVVVIIGIANFMWVIVENTSPGTSESSWRRPHSDSLFITHPLAIIAMAYLLFRFVFPALIGRGQRDGEVIAPFEPPIAVTRCSGKIGAVKFDGPLLKLSVFHDRLVIRPILMGDRTIMGQHIRSVASERTLLGSPPLVIDHSAPGLKSPVLLRLSANHPVRMAIDQISREPRPGIETAVSERATFWTLTSIMSVAGIVMGIFFVGLGITLMVTNFDFFFVIWTLFAVVITAKSVRDLTRERSRDLRP
jgi:hypothetical protein